MKGKGVIGDERAKGGNRIKVGDGRSQSPAPNPVKVSAKDRYRIRVPRPDSQLEHKGTEDGRWR